jgi:endogenous inhibitor of DNA gyrase (YacG/DUF329 family)
MNLSQKTNIAELRGQGETYAAIADKVGVSENTVKSYCRRNNIGVTAEKESGVCPNCGRPLIQLPHKRQKRFCSEKCRLAWWKAHPEALNKKAVYNFTCTVCGKRFTAYGNANRKYCSRDCAVAARRASNE